jgi:SNF2 family DNA or RNA helicase
VRGAPQGHKLKNPKMQLVKALRGVRTRRTLLLSGTPIQNNLEEMWALMDLVAPAVLGDQREFKDRFQKRIVAGSARDATARERTVGAAAAQEMRRLMTPYFLRREKRSVLGGASAAAAGMTESGGAAAEEAVAAAAAAAAAVASAAPQVPSLGHKHDLIVWVKLTAPQRRLYLTFLSSASVRNALNKVRGCVSVTTRKSVAPGLRSTRGGMRPVKLIQSAVAISISLNGSNTKPPKKRRGYVKGMEAASELWKPSSHSCERSILFSARPSL